MRIESGCCEMADGALRSAVAAPALLEGTRADRPDTPAGPGDRHGDAERIADRITLSEEGLLMAADADHANLEPSRDGGPGDGRPDGRPRADGELSSADRQELGELKQRDAEVRAHENAHLRALGPYRTGGPSFQYETGPDGLRYAVAGEVPVDTAPESTPEETIRKARTVRRAALAPADPSSADRQVAADAARLEQQARFELADERREGGGEEPAQSGAVPTRTASGAASTPEAYGESESRPVWSISI